MALTSKVLSHSRCIFTSCLVFCLLLLSFYAFNKQFSKLYYQRRISLHYNGEANSDDKHKMDNGDGNQTKIFVNITKDANCDDIYKLVSDDDYTEVDLNTTSGYLLEYKTPVRGEDNIIFLETFCAVNVTARMSMKIELDHQQACAIESAANTNPNASIYLFNSCPLNNASLSLSSRVVQRVFQYPNVYLWHESMESFFKGTPLEKFYRSGKMKQSISPVSHASDVLRFLVLWKYGGVYLDLDFIVRRSLKDLGGNYACAEMDNVVASGAMHFGTDSVGKHFADLCVEELRTNFRGDIWNYNGPGLITRVLTQQCNVKESTLMTRSACKGFNVYPPDFFYPNLYDWMLFYDELKSVNTMESMNTSHAVHLWNSLRVNYGYSDDTMLLRYGSLQPILQLQREFCPIVFHHYPLFTNNAKLDYGLGPLLLSVIYYILVCIT